MGILDKLMGRQAMTPAEAAKAAKNGEIVLVDVREADEWRSGHSPDARHIPLGEVESRLGDLQSTGKPVAFVCRSGGRSGRATSTASDAGIDARNVTGGMLAWEKAGLPTV